MTLVSVVIRTYNEQRHLDALLCAIAKQYCEDFSIETVIIDSGSTDETLVIARQHNCRITFIKKEEFTFGRSLNVGCAFAKGDVLVFVSGHCIPANELWLANLIAPIRNGKAVYTYGRQIGYDTTRFSERRVFAKYYPTQSRIPQEGFFCNNANAALLREAWQHIPFDENLTGLEDMHLAKKLLESGGKIAYVADASVSHIHDESWRQVKIRYEREAIALRNIMPEIHVNIFDAVRYFVSAVTDDFRASAREGNFFQYWREILAFRFCQFWGGYRGNHIHRKLSKQAKERYFYPTLTIDGKHHEQNHRIATDESK